MCTVFHALGMLVRDRKAAAAVEYGLILALVVLAVLGSLQVLGSVTTDMWNTVAEKVRLAMP